MSKRRFRIAFSFAEEKRVFVAEVAAILATEVGKQQILYDKFHEAELARHDLGLYLPKLYRDESDLIVAVLSRDYDEKRWTGWEWLAIHALLTKADGYRVMPCRFGFANIDGLQDNAGYVELDEKLPKQAADLILERLRLNETKAKGDELTGGDGKQQPLSTSIPHNLPTLQPFFGREEELRKIADSLAPDNHTWGALIDGPGGIGKTSLAVRAAYDASADHFKKIIFISLKTHELEDDGLRDLRPFILSGVVNLLNELACQLERPDIIALPEDQRPRLLVDALRGTHTLLVLDNLENLRRPERDILFIFIRRLPTGCKAIFTSRVRIGSGAEELILEKFSEQAALATLAELANHNPFLAQTSEAERLALYVETGGKPLLLRWTAGQLGRGSCLTVKDALRFLRSCPKENDPLEFIFSDLVEDFDAAETQALCALTYFALPASVEHVAILAELPEPETDCALRSLTVRSLAVPNAELTSFTLVPMVADFLRKKRHEAVQETGNRLEKRAYALIIENGLHNHTRFPILDANWPYVRPALPLFLDGPNERLQSICDALRQFLNFMGRWDEWLDLSEKAETKALVNGDYYEAGWRAFQAGQVHRHRRNAEEVFKAADHASFHWALCDGPTFREKGCVEALRGRGHYVDRKYRLATVHFNAALAIFKQHRDGSPRSPVEYNIATALNGLADAERHLKEFGQAEDHYREAQQLARAICSPETEASATANLAQTALEQGQWPEAELRAREAMPLVQAVHRKELIGRTNRVLAHALVRQGKAAEALPHARLAVDIFTRLNSPYLTVAQATLAECDKALGEGKG